MIDCLLSILQRHTDDGLRTANSKYIGSAYTDVQYAINSMADDWGVLGHSVMGDSVIDWIEKGKPMGTPKMICNGDIMLHVTKVRGLWMFEDINDTAEYVFLNILRVNMTQSFVFWKCSGNSAYFE